MNHVNSKVTSTKIVTLMCESDNQNLQNTNGLRDVEIRLETEDGWFGKPIANPACSEIFYPRFAWKVAP